MLLLVVYYIIQPILRTFGTWGWMSWRSDCRATSDPWWSTTCFNETMNQIRRRVLNETMNQIRRRVLDGTMNQICRRVLHGTMNQIRRRVLDGRMN